MSDLISRQAAIDKFVKLGDYYNGRDEVKRGIHQCIAATYDLPSAQPKTQLSTEDTTFDCISRQAAIDAADMADYPGLSIEDVDKVTGEVVKALKELPSAQPEIIRCKDCRYYEREGTKGYCNDLYGFGRYWEADDFCSYAERREE